MVALNYQTFDEHMQLNRGRFRTNGGCGYLLKPAILRSAKGFDAWAPTETTKKLTVHVIRGQLSGLTPVGAIQGHHANSKDLEHFSKMLHNPALFVTVSVIGVHSDERTFKSGTVKGNGLNPTWNLHTEFRIGVPELASLRVQLFQHMTGTARGHNELIGQYVVQLESLRVGHRQVFLESPRCKRLPGCSLSVVVDWEGAEPRRNSSPPRQRQSARRTSAGGEAGAGPVEWTVMPEVLKSHSGF